MVPRQEQITVFVCPQHAPPLPAGLATALSFQVPDMLLRCASKPAGGHRNPWGISGVRTETGYSGGGIL